MAFSPLSTQHTLGRVIAIVRERVGKISPQESLLLDSQLTDIIHNAVLDVRGKIGVALDPMYRTTANSARTEIAEATNLISLSALSIARYDDLVLYDWTWGPVPLKTPEQFDNMKALYSTGDLASAAFCKVSNENDGTDTKPYIRTFRGTTVAAPGALSLSYTRNPAKASVGTTFLDFPDAYMGLVIDRAAELAGVKSA